MKREPKDKTIPKGKTPFGRFEQLAKKVVTTPKRKKEAGDKSKTSS
ncbi:MAG: hypothetical protein HY529_05300 [Chloroflexi bacterium]|nr:hypothetical protein [Chloroflexota bacterium]